MAAFLSVLSQGGSQAPPPLEVFTDHKAIVDAIARGGMVLLGDVSACGRLAADLAPP